MGEYKIDARLFKEMVISAANYLDQNKQTLNDLNVFPVPDGDTGTNMSLTMLSAAKNVSACNSDKVGAVSEALSTGALKGARGNSGVILSQLFRGFALTVDKKEEILSSKLFVDAINAGVAAAYKAVMRPKEGTILTVAKAMSEEARKAQQDNADVLELLNRIIDAGSEMLNRTPEMLPVLKEAGVVDAGGAGLIVVYKGFRKAILGEDVANSINIDLSKPQKVSSASANNNISTADIKFGYCTEFFITNLKKDVTQRNVDDLRDKLSEMGDSLVVVGGGDLVKIHVHTNNPGTALQYALALGQLSSIKIENMREQHSALSDGAVSEPEPIPVPVKKTATKKIAIVAVAAGEGLEDIFKNVNVDCIIKGGQSMNPSIEDIHRAIEDAPSDNVIVLPNNKNIILAAQQAKNLTEKNVYVIPSKSFPQGLSAVLAFNSAATPEENEALMTEAVSSVKTGEITFAVRDTHVNGFDIKENDILGLLDGDIVACGNEKLQTLLELIKCTTDSFDGSLISIYYGCDVDENEASETEKIINEKYADYDVEMYSGGQSIYDYIIAVE